MSEQVTYVSTRDVDEQIESYSDVLLQGLAPDGGLFVPDAVPQLSADTLRTLSGKPYTELFTHVKGLLVGQDIPAQAQRQIAQGAYNEENFPGAYDGNIVPVYQIQPDLFIQQLSNGPTGAFKDMALQPLARDMDFVLAQRGGWVALLGATSGDTGSSAEAAVKGLNTMGLVMLSPETGMSAFQRAQMGRLSGENIYNVSIPGRFDDCQNIVKAIKKDPEFAHLGAVNSINWGRVASQIPYYVSGYLQAVGENIGQPVDFVVPTGNFGNVLAGHIARKMGVPIRKLIVATNENNVLDRLIQTGVYEKPVEAQITTSPSMDITVASNYERLVYELFSNDPTLTSKYMREFERTGRVDFADFGLPADVLQKLGFDSGSSTAQNRLDTIAWVYHIGGGIIDPHTADAVYVARHKKASGVPMVCMSTALPVKFEDTVREAIGHVPPREPRFAHVEAEGQGGFDLVPNSPEAVKDYLRRKIGSFAQL